MTSMQIIGGGITVEAITEARRIMDEAQAPSIFTIDYLSEGQIIKLCGHQIFEEHVDKPVQLPHDWWNQGRKY